MDSNKPYTLLNACWYGLLTTLLLTMRFVECLFVRACRLFLSRPFHCDSAAIAGLQSSLKNTSSIPTSEFRLTHIHQVRSNQKHNATRLETSTHLPARLVVDIQCIANRRLTSDSLQSYLDRISTPELSSEQTLELGKQLRAIRWNVPRCSIF